MRNPKILDRSTRKMMRHRCDDIWIKNIFNRGVDKSVEDSTKKKKIGRQYMIHHYIL